MMDIKDEALLNYLEFNLLAMVSQLKPHLNESCTEEELYAHAQVVLTEIKEAITQPSGLQAVKR